MNFELSDEQQQLADAVRKILAGSYGFEQRQAVLRSASGFSDSTWATLADMGLMALALPEADGGFGGGAVDLMAPMEACGEALLVEPLLDHIVAGRLLARTGSVPQRAALLPGLIDGTRHLAFASLEPGQRYALAPVATTAEQSSGVWVLDGAKSVVVGAAQAHTLIVSARTPEGTSLFVVDAKEGTGQRLATAKFDVDAKANTFTLTFQGGAKNGQKVHGILALKGDELKLCYTPDSNSRPAKFESVKWADTFCETWKRLKK